MYVLTWTYSRYIVKSNPLAPLDKVVKLQILFFQFHRNGPKKKGCAIVDRDYSDQQSGQHK